ncbi:MAG: LptE family protein [Bacteroidetes bacterium]|nr:LptE family protein [Bacteroidota bacterium]
MKIFPAHKNIIIGRALFALFIILSAVLIGGCYSFTGSSVPPHLKTVAVPLFEDVSGFGEPNLRENLTQKVTDLIINDNTLEIADRTSSDCILEGTIVSVSDAPSVIAPGEQVTTRRVTITVRATFTDMKFRKKLWEKSFSQWGEYAQSSEPRTNAIDEAVNKIAEDILIETVSGW